MSLSLFFRNNCRVSSVQRQLSSVAASKAQSVKPVGTPTIRLRPRHDKNEILPPQNIFLAIDLIKAKSWANFDETVEVAAKLGVDPRKPNQSVKGVASLPHGTGKKVRVAVFAVGQDAQDALDAGADVVGGADLVARVLAGEVAFDRVIATPELMSAVSKIRAGAVQFRVDKQGIIHAGVGKLSFSSEALMENIRALMVAISDVKPENYKGVYLTGVSLSSTMGPGIKLDTGNVDPSNGKFMLHPSEYLK